MFDKHHTTGDKRPVKVNGRAIGWLAGDTFYKSVIGSKHKLRQPPAWAIDAEAFSREVKPNAAKIVVIDKEADVEYCASMETFVRHSFRFNRGFFDQYALPLQYWQTEGNGHRQLSLWGGGSNG